MVSKPAKVVWLTTGTPTCTSKSRVYVTQNTHLHPHYEFSFCTAFG